MMTYFLHFLFFSFRVLHIMVFSVWGFVLFHTINHHSGSGFAFTFH